MQILTSASKSRGLKNSLRRKLVHKYSLVFGSSCRFMLSFQTEEVVRLVEKWFTAVGCHSSHFHNSLTRKRILEGDWLSMTSDLINRLKCHSTTKNMTSLSYSVTSLSLSVTVILQQFSISIELCRLTSKNVDYFAWKTTPNWRFRIKMQR